MKQSIDWAIAQNADAKSPYFGKIDPTKVAVSGFSCGGIQALNLASAPRVKAVVIDNSGFLPDGSPPMAFISTTKARLHRCGRHRPFYKRGYRLCPASERGGRSN